MSTNTLVPMVIHKTKDGERAMDLWSRLLEDRIIMLHDGVDSASASVISSAMLYLASVDSEKPIQFYINSPGGSVVDGFQIYDTMRMIKPPVHTFIVGQAASMGSFLASSGEKGHRYISKNSTHMMHQVSSGMGRSNIQDMEVSMEETKRINAQLLNIYSENTGKSIDELKAHMVRDNFMVPEECVEFGLSDVII